MDNMGITRLGNVALTYDYVINIGNRWDELEPVDCARTEEEAITIAKNHKGRCKEVVYSPVDYSDDEIVWRNIWRKKQL